LGALGDLVEDVVVHLLEPVNAASDTHSIVTRRRGGSAANVVEAACRAGGRARFIGQIGDDATGRSLTEALVAAGAEVVGRRGGRTGTIIVLVGPDGERTMLTDRGACTDLDIADPDWLDGLHTLHVPYYSLVGEPLATTTAALVEHAHRRGIRVSVDVSSTAVLTAEGPARALARVADLRPHVVLANEAEAEVLGDGLRPHRLHGALVVVKRGPSPASIHTDDGGERLVPAMHVPDVRDTTGAGDAFAAGLLLALAEGLGPEQAVQRAHEVAAHAVRRASAR
jgi:sugar/nucleoside kinase (ribokinase family)